jgi:hypothetical protein
MFLNFLFKKGAQKDSKIIKLIRANEAKIEKKHLFYGKENSRT